MSADRRPRRVWAPRPVLWAVPTALFAACALALAVLTAPLKASLFLYMLAGVPLPALDFPYTRWRLRRLGLDGLAKAYYWPEGLGQAERDAARRMIWLEAVVAALTVGPFGALTSLVDWPANIAMCGGFLASIVGFGYPLHMSLWRRARELANEAAADGQPD